MGADWWKPRKNRVCILVVYSHKIPQKLTTTACFVREESSGGRPVGLATPLFTRPNFSLTNFMCPMFFDRVN